MTSQVDPTPRIEQLRSVAEGVLAEEAAGKIELPENREIIFVSPEDILGLIVAIEWAAKTIDNVISALPVSEKAREKMSVEEKNIVYARAALTERLGRMSKLLDAGVLLEENVSYNARGIFPTKDAKPSN